MAWVIAVLGAALAAGGGAALWSGSGYIRLDWGQAQTVAGTVALSAGVVTLAIAAVLFQLRGALRDLARQPAARPLGAASPEVSGVGLEAVHPVEEVGGPVPAEAPAKARGRLAGRLTRVGVPKPEGAGSVASEAATRDPSAAEPVDTPYRTAQVPASAEAEPAYEPRAPSGSIAVPEAPRPASTMAEAPTVVGRYEANGASYVLFSDGTIEVETDSGTHRFASMADLKEHIERQDAG